MPALVGGNRSCRDVSALVDLGRQIHGFVGWIVVVGQLARNTNNLNAIKPIEIEHAPRDLGSRESAGEVALGILFKTVL